MKALIISNCPYCKHENKQQLEIPGSYVPTIDRQVITCAIEEGGCDKSYAVEITINATVKSGKIQF